MIDGGSDGCDSSWGGLGRAFSVPTESVRDGDRGSWTVGRPPSTLSLLPLAPFRRLMRRVRRSSSALSLLRLKRSPPTSELLRRPRSMLAARSATSSPSDTWFSVSPSPPSSGIGGLRRPFSSGLASPSAGFSAPSSPSSPSASGGFWPEATRTW